jgi:hypothetical protein
VSGRRRGDKLPPKRRTDVALTLAVLALLTAWGPVARELLDGLL